jgi:flagellar basal body P-ring formation protein FlgA
MMLRIAFFFVALVMAYPAYADPGMRVITPAHDIARGQVIGDSDFVYGTIPANTVFSGILTAVDQVRGLEARRMLRAGEIVRTDDVRHPVVVAKGAMVTMTFEAPGVTLTATGRAMSEGGIGDTVTVQNPASYRQISCIVTGPGAVRATGPAPATRIAAAH